MDNRMKDNGKSIAVTAVLCAIMLAAMTIGNAQEQNQLLNWLKDGENPDDLKVASLLPTGNAVTEVDDGDNNTNTKAFIYRLSAGASITVVATPDKAMQEADLPNEWTLTGGTGNGKLSRTVSLHEPGKFVLKCQCGDSLKETTIYVVSMYFLKPSGDPVEHGSSDNEFVFSDASTGVLTIDLSVQVTPAEAAGRIRNLCTFSVGNIIGSNLSWNDSNPNGRPTATADGKLQAAVTFSGLPTLNSRFGGKTASITCATNGTPYIVQQDYEVFYDRDATNHPACQDCSGCPNWFYYWRQVCRHEPMRYVNNNPLAGRVPAMFFWSYRLSHNKRLIEIGNQHPGAGSSYGVGVFVSGIDMFAKTVIHELKHIEQISMADLLLPTDGNDSFRYGWSWNVEIHNHWTKGPDGEWGDANLDDDNDNEVNNAAPVPEFEPGKGDDVNLGYEDSGKKWWPKAWALPTGKYANIHPIEGEAVKAADDAVNEHDNARSDWGKPGKNHRTLNKWDD